MKKTALNISTEILTREYLILGSSYRVAEKYSVSATAVKRILRDAGVLRTQSEAASIRKRHEPYIRTEEHRSRLSEFAKERTGEKNPFFNHTHSDEFKARLSIVASARTGKRNPNYKNGKYLRRPRDFKIAEFTPIRNNAFNRDNFTCLFCKIKGGNLHAHHLLPYWIRPEAFLDIDNLTTVCTNCHFEQAHLSNWHHFNTDIVSDQLILKYSLDRERLNDLAIFKEGGCDSPNSANKINAEKTVRNDCLIEKITQ